MQTRKIIMAGAALEVAAGRAEMLVQTGRAQYAEVVESLRRAADLETAEAAPKPETAVKRTKRTRKPKK